MAVAILDQIYKKVGSGESARYEGTEFSLNADTLYVKIKKGDGAAESYVSLSTILQNYANFAYNYDGLAVTTSDGFPPTNKNVLIWVDDNPRTYDDGIIFTNDDSIGGN